MQGTLKEIPSLMCEVIEERGESLSNRLNQLSQEESNPEIAREVVYLALRHFEDIAWTWNRIHDTLSTGLPGPVARKVFANAFGMCDAWLPLASIAKKMAASVQGLPETSGKLRQELAVDVEKIDSAIEKIKAAREEAKGIKAMMNAPMPDVDPQRLAEADKLYSQGKFVDFKEANIRRKTSRG